MSTILENECHFYQFKQRGSSAPQLDVTAGSVTYEVKEGAINDLTGGVITQATVVETFGGAVPISVPLHGEERVYTLRVIGKALESDYQIFTGDAEIFSRDQKDPDLPSEDPSGNCQHRSFQRR